MPAGQIEPAGPLLTLPEAAERLGLVVTRVHQLLRERQLLAVPADGGRRIPADFLQDGLVVKGLPGTITLLTDGGYADADIVRWLFTEDESLPGRPVDALRADRGREVRRRAQALAF